MSLPQHIRYGTGGTLRIELEEQPTNALGTLRTDDGGVRGVITGTISTISTTLNVAATRGDRIISVDSNVGMAVGGTMWIQDDPEDVLIRKVDGCNIYLRRPVMYDHVNAAAVEGTVVTFDANSDVAGKRWWDGHLEVNIDGGAAFHYLSVECTDYPVTMLCTTQQMFDLEPALYQIVDDEVDLDRLRDTAAAHVLARLAVMAPELRARVYPGGVEFALAVSMAAMMFHYGARSGDDARELYDRYRERLDSELQRVAQTTPRDKDQDGRIEPSDKIGARTGRLARG